MRYKYIGCFVIVIIFGLSVFAETGNGRVALILVCVSGVPLGIHWYLNKPPKPPKKRPKPPKPVVSKVPVEKEKASAPPKTSEPPQKEYPEEKSFTLLGRARGSRYGTSAWMRQTDKGFEMIVEYHAPNPFEHFGTSNIVPDEIIGLMSLQALQNWMYTNETPAFHEEITAKEVDYRQFLRECGVTGQTKNEFNFTYSIEVAFEKIINTAKEKFIYCLDFKEPHHTIGHYRATVNFYAGTFDLFFEQIDESGDNFESGVILAQWTITQNCDDHNAETKPEQSDIYILTDSAYHNILDMLGGWDAIIPGDRT